MQVQHVMLEHVMKRHHAQALRSKCAVKQHEQHPCAPHGQMSAYWGHSQINAVLYLFICVPE